MAADHTNLLSTVLFQGATTDRPSWSEIWWLIFRLRETVRGITADSSRLHNMVLSMHNCWHRQSAAHTPSRDTTDDRLVLHCVILRRWSDGHSLPEAIKRSWNLLFKKVGTSHRHAWSLKYETLSLGGGVGVVLIYWCWVRTAWNNMLDCIFSWALSNGIIELYIHFMVVIVSKICLLIDDFISCFETMGGG